MFAQHRRIICQIAAITCLIAALAAPALAQVENKQGQPMQGQPMQGQPMQGQPMQGQPMQGQPMQGQPMQGQPMQGQPMQGQPMQGQPGPGAAQWPPEKCQAQEKKVRKMGDSCLLPKTTDKRKACLDKNQKNFPKEFWESCRGLLEGLRNEYGEKEKTKFPDQASAFRSTGENKGPQDGQGPGTMPNTGSGQGPHGMPSDQAHKAQEHKGKKVDCEKVVKKLRKEAESCLKKKEQGKRKMCFEKVGQHVEKSGADKECDPVVGPMKEEYMQKEKTLFPNDPPSMSN